MVFYVVLLPVQLRTPLGFRFAPSDLAVFGMAALAIVSLGRIPTAKRDFALAHGFLMAVAGTGLLVAGIHDGAVSSYAVVQKTFGLAVLILTTAMITGAISTLPKLDRLIRILVWSVAGHAGLALALFLSGTQLPIPGLIANVYSQRLSGFLIDPNAFGFLVATALALTLFGAYRPKGRFGRAEILLLGGFLAIALFLTYSRSAYLAFAAASLVYFLARPGFFGRPIVIFLVVLMLAGLAAVAPALQEDELVQRENTIATRFQLLEFSWEEFSRSPIVGMGAGRFVQAYGLIPHNTFAFMAADYGILGILALVALLFRYGSRALQLQRAIGERPAQAVGLFSTFCGAIAFSFGVEALYQRPWWLLMALIFSQHQLVWGSWKRYRALTIDGSSARGHLAALSSKQNPTFARQA